jgi:pimeloyl-ACP methyl ester carboxylesterase
MDINILKTSSGHIEFSIIGKGTPILFFHGGHSNCRETLFHKGFDTNKYMLIIPSRPGYGYTPLEDHTTPEKTAELVHALINDLGINKVIVYAISAGGLPGIAFAAIYPEKVDKLVLASAVTKKWLHKTDKVYKAGKKLFNPRMERNTWSMVRTFSGIFPSMIAKNFYKQFSSAKPYKLDKGDVKELIDTFQHYCSKTGFISDLEHNIPDNMLSQIQCPTLIAHSKNDQSVSFDHAEHAYKQIPNAQLLTLKNEWGHLLWIGKDSTDSIKEILKFVENEETTE